ncbi:hypothetical protein E4U09_005300 [Claviceps aff. purpurea]|uniref:Uncharacterized protein n=1 Tax=Claviceps aff. purpurea TaxID=1967640 RepID=A0A9P7U007_9HYPO|nr:hypothetical protein E4U09_005300 [Claviceps aff. purpurea]
MGDQAPNRMLAQKLLPPRLFQEPPLPSPRTAGITHIQTAADSHLKAERDEAPVSKDLVANSVTESLVEPHQRNLGDAEGDAEEEDTSVPLNSTTTRALRQLLQPAPVTSLSSVLTKPLTMELLLMKNNPPTAKTVLVSKSLAIPLTIERGKKKRHCEGNLTLQHICFLRIRDLP